MGIGYEEAWLEVAAMERVRCFIAVDVDDPPILSGLLSVQEEMARLGCDVKLVERENIHLTLRFLGEIPPGLVEEVKKALDKLSGEAFDMRLQGLGAFPTPARPRVVWVGVAEGAEQLKALHAQLNTLLKPLGFPPEKEAFVPHITLARVKSSRNLSSLAGLIRSLADRDFGVQRVEQVKLKRSVLTPKGPVYSDLHVKELKGTSA